MYKEYKGHTTIFFNFFLNYESKFRILNNIHFPFLGRTSCGQPPVRVTVYKVGGDYFYI